MSAWDNDISPERRSARLTVLVVTALIAFLITLCRLANIQIVHHGYYSEVACGQHTTQIDVQARRGRILDRNGYLLAGNRTLVDFQVYWPNVPQDTREQIDQLLIELGEHAIADSQSSYCNQILAVEVPYQRAMEIMDSGLPPGVSAVIRQERTYPMGDLAAGVVGRQTDEYTEGIELSCNSQLQGMDGRLFIERSATGRYDLIDPDADNTVVHDGTDVMLTLDSRFQCIVMEELEDAVLKYGAQWASAVLVDPHTGEILAAGSVPVRADNGALAMNRCFQGFHEPGSTFKIITYSACIEEGLIAADQMFNCSDGYIDVAGDSITDAHRLGELSFDEIIINSSNVGTVMLARILTDSSLCGYARDFGFGLRTMIEYPNESRGILPFPGDRGWSGVSAAQISIGQEVTVTPLQLAMAYCVIANGGTLYYPRLVEARRVNGSWVDERSIARAHPISPGTAAIVRRTLRAVVEEGTGTSAAVDGLAVGGKTGTAERLSGTTDYLSAFVGMVPAEDPTLVLAVVIDGPEYQYRWGSASAAPVFSRVVSRVMAVEPRLARGPSSRSAGQDHGLVAGVIE